MSQYWDLVPAIVGGVIGALAGGIPAWLLAKRQSDETLKRDKQERLDQEKTAASRVFVKLSILANSILSLKKQIDDMDERAERDGRSDMRLFERVSPIVGLDIEKPVEFTAEDLSMFVAAKRVDYVDDLLLLARRQAAIVGGLREYGRLKVEHYYLHVSKGVTTRAEDGVSTTRLRVSAEDANFLRVKGEELDIYLRALRAQLDEYAEQARRVANEYGNIVRTYFDDASLPTLTEEKSSSPR